MQWRLLQCEKDPRKKCNVISKGKETCLGGDKVWCQKADEYTTTLQDFLCRYSPHPPWEFPSCVCGVVWVEEENREKKIKWQAEEKGKNVVVVTVLPQHKFGFHEEKKFLRPDSCHFSSLSCDSCGSGGGATMCISRCSCNFMFL